MVRAAPKPSFRAASCCNVVVRNGAYGRRLYGFDSTPRTSKLAAENASANARARDSSRCTTFWVRSSPTLEKSRPVATLEPSSDTSRTFIRRGLLDSPASRSAVRSQYEAARNAIRSRSRSTTNRVATLCTRPADSRGMTFFQSTGLTSYPYSRSRIRRVSCASTRFSSIVRGFSIACWIASGVISWNTIRYTGTFGSSSSNRCQAIASPSRSSSVAR